MRLIQLAAEHGDTYTTGNAAIGKLIVATIIIMALWGQKTDRGE